MRLWVEFVLLARARTRTRHGGRAGAESGVNLAAIARDGPESGRKLNGWTCRFPVLEPSVRAIGPVAVTSSNWGRRAEQLPAPELWSGLIKGAGAGGTASELVTLREPIAPPKVRWAFKVAILEGPELR